MFTKLRIGIGLALGLAVVGNGLATDKAGKGDQSPVPKWEGVATVVYPLNALMKRQRGTVSVDFLVDRAGRLHKATILKSPGPAFTGAVLAYGDAQNFSWWAEPKKKDDAETASMPFVLVHQDIEFDERKSGDVAHSIACPSKAAMRVLEELRYGHKGKGFSTLKDLDRPLAFVKQRSPVFPLSLEGKVDKGKALIEFYVNEKGWAVLPHIISATDDAFGYSACQAISAWQFQPPKCDGKSTVVKVRVPVNFDQAK